MNITNAGYVLKYFYNLIRSSKCERPQTWEQKNPWFNRFALIVWGVPRCDKDSISHTNRFSTKSPDCEHGKPRRISGDLRINTIFFIIIAILEQSTYKGNNM